MDLVCINTNVQYEVGLHWALLTMLVDLGRVCVACVH